MDTSLGAERVVRVLDRLKEQRGLPERVVMDNGPELTSKALDAWARAAGVKLHFTRPGKPTENAYVEGFNARVREECLNESWFRNLLDARTTIENWRRHYDEERPHSSLFGSTHGRARHGGPQDSLRMKRKRSIFRHRCAFRPTNLSVRSAARDDFVGWRPVRAAAPLFAPAETPCSSSATSTSDSYQNVSPPRPPHCFVSSRSGAIRALQSANRFVRNGLHFAASRRARRGEVAA